MAASFLEKLKKGMGIEIPEEPEKEKLEEKPRKESKPSVEKTKPTLKKKKARKIKIGPELDEPARQNFVKNLSGPADQSFAKNLDELKTKNVEEEIKEEKETKKEEEKIEVKKEAWFEPEGQLAIDVYQTEKDLVIQSAIAGVKPENLDISIENDVVTIKGKRENPAAEKEIKYFHQECYWGPFSREIILPEETDPSRAEATMKEGILIIRIPKIERKKKRKIVVKG